MEIYYYWLIAAAILLIVEIMTAGFGAIFFAVGAAVAALVAFITPSFTLQILSFAVVSFLSFIFVRPIAMRFLDKNSNEVKTNADALVGRKGIVSETIDTHAHTGRVAIDGDDWKAVPETDSVIEKGAEVTVVSRDSIVLTVR